MGIEPTQPAWKAGILAVELHPRLNEIYDIINFYNSQEFLLFLFKKFLTKKNKYYIIYDMPLWWNRQTQGT